MEPLGDKSVGVGDLRYEDWGLVDYDQALIRQESLVQQVLESGSPGVVVFCTHPPVITLGRKTQPGDVFGIEIPTLEVNRGGRATYHGPSQLVVYPITNLDRSRAGRDIGSYLRNLEAAIVQALAHFGVKAQGKSRQQKSSNTAFENETGVWVGSRKIASLGIGVRKWITFHGAAINLDHDPKAFTGMNPCGFHRETMLSLQELLGHAVDHGTFQDQLWQQLQLTLA